MATLAGMQLAIRLSLEHPKEAKQLLDAMEAGVKPNRAMEDRIVERMVKVIRKKGATNGNREG